MGRIERLMIAVDRLLETKRKRHIASGLLVSVALLCCGLAVTVYTIKTEPVEIQENHSEDVVYLE